MNGRPPLSDDERESALQHIVGHSLQSIVGAAKALSSDKTTTSRLLALLATEDRVENRHAILYALSWHANLETWDLMVHIFADVREDPTVRGQAAEALSCMFAYQRSDCKEFEDAVRTLIDGLRDPSLEVRYCAVNALGSTGHTPLEPVIRGMLDDSTPIKEWIGTVGDEASRALECLELAHSMRLKDGL